MPATFITTDDLEKFKQEIITEISRILSSGISQKKWGRSAEVCKKYGISASTLQNFRNSGALPFTKLNGVVFFNLDEIERIMEALTQNRK